MQKLRMCKNRKAEGKTSKKKADKRKKNEKQIK
jgi:hypothetical protein